jgi:hypothetical protein
VGSAGDPLEVQATHQGDKQEQAPQAGAEGTWAQIQLADVGHSSRFRLEGLGSFVVPAAGEASEAFFAHEHRQSIDADGMAGLAQFPLDVIDGKVLFAQGHGPLTYAVACGGVVGAGFGDLEEAGAFGWVVAELVAEDAEGIGGVTEAASGLGSGQLFDKEGAKGLILAVVGEFRGEEEAGVLGNSYLISSIDSHIFMLSHNIGNVNR